MEVPEPAGANAWESPAESRLRAAFSVPQTMAVVLRFEQTMNGFFPRSSRGLEDLRQSGVAKTSRRVRTEHQNQL